MILNLDQRDFDFGATVILILEQHVFEMIQDNLDFWSKMILEREVGTIWFWIWSMIFEVWSNMFLKLEVDVKQTCLLRAI